MGEILGLTWAGVDLSRRTVMVFKSKNGERRTIPAQSDRAGTAEAQIWKPTGGNGVGVSERSADAVECEQISRSLHLALKKAKMTDFHFHDLRHTFATRMVQAGVDLYKVQRLLGHKSPIMTQRYAHHYPESLRDGVEVLDVGRKVSTNLAQLRVVLEAVLQAVEKLVPPIRIERTTNGLGNRCSIQLSYGGSQHFQLLSLMGWLVSSIKCSRRVPLKVFVKGFRRLRQVLLINRIVSLPHLFRLVADDLHCRCCVYPCPSEVR